jgi:nitrite reductase (NADH) small subunit
MPAIPIGPLTQIPPGEGRNFLVAETMIAVFRTREDGVFATQAQCPHRGGPLADGLVDAHSVVCPLHDRIFALATGQGIGNDCVIEVYKTHVDEQGIVTVAL